MLIPAPSATLQSEVNSNTISRVAIGPPITALATAARPATANKEWLISTNIPDKYAKILPVQTPMNNAGEKIPPNNPSLIQTTVKKSLPIKSRTK